MGHTSGPLNEPGTPARASTALVAVNAIKEDVLVARSLEDLYAEIAAKHGPQPIVVHFDRKHIKTSEVHGPHDKDVVKPLRIALHVPVDGSVGALHKVPNRVVSDM